VSVNLDHCLYREDCSEAVSSYIIASEATSSRTIVNHNALPEMTLAEFVSIAGTMLSGSDHSSEENDIAAGTIWFHFEGRIPDTTLKCIGYLREHSSFNDAGGPTLKISVELEKPGREGLQALALLADVVFYSRSWAEGEGYTSAEMCLREQAAIICNHSTRSEYQPSKGQLLICTWGASGASAITVGTLGVCDTSPEQDTRPALHVEHSAAFVSPGKPIVDTTGAGDTFIAGVLFELICKGNFGTDDESWPLKRTLDFANQLAGRKILQHGFRVEGISFGPR
jgi:ketohexokinase